MDGSNNSGALGRKRLSFTPSYDSSVNKRTDRKYLSRETLRGPAQPREQTHPTQVNNITNTNTAATDASSAACGANHDHLAAHAPQNKPVSSEIPNVFNLPQRTADPAQEQTHTPHTAQDEEAAAIVDARIYNLTVGQAQDLFTEAKRKVPKERTIQDYCARGLLAGKKVTRAKITEWLINENSLMAFIAKKPELLEVGPTDEPAQPPQEKTHAPQENAVTADTAVEPVGEKRTLAQLIVENAHLEGKLTAIERALTGKDDVITELKDDRSFLREELVEKRSLNKDLKDLTDKMMAVINKSIRPGNEIEEGNTGHETDPTQIKATIVSENKPLSGQN